MCIIGDTVQLRSDTAVTHQDALEVWPVYRAVFDDHDSLEAWRSAVWDKHSTRAGFRLVRAYAEETLVGFAYGYVGEPGQWWTERARELLASDVAADWLDGHFEVVSLGVLAQVRSNGVGRALLRRLCEEAAPERWLLMTTADESDSARRLYASEDWQVIGPGLSDAQVIMAKGEPRRGVTS